MPIVDFDELWDYSKPQETESRFRDLVPEFQSAADSDLYLQLLTQIARTLGLQAKFSEANEILDQVSSNLKPNHFTARIRYLLEKGRVMNSSGDFKSAKPVFLEAWAFANENGLDYYGVDAAHMIALVDGRAGNHEGKLSWEEKALKLAESSKEKKAKKWLGSLYNNMGWSYHDMGNFQKSLELFKKSFQFHEKAARQKQMWIAKWSIARVNRSMGNIKDSLKMNLDLLAEYGGEDPAGFTYEEIGECLLALGRNDEATAYFKKAWEIFSNDIWIQKNEPNRLKRMKELAGL